MSAALSYSSGESATPLLGDTIGGNFDATVRAFGDREALVDRPTGRRWTYAELAADVDALALGLLEMGIEQGGPGRHLGAELRRMDAHPVRDRQDRRDPGEHQPGLPHPRAGVRAQPVGHHAARRGASS